ncbi:phospholipase A [Helicobacter saguini]|nr:phospholipase A [Helicobacter saguini]
MITFGRKILLFFCFFGYLYGQNIESNLQDSNIIDSIDSKNKSSAQIENLDSKKVSFFITNDSAKVQNDLIKMANKDSIKVTDSITLVENIESSDLKDSKDSKDSKPINSANSTTNDNNKSTQKVTDSITLESNKDTNQNISENEKNKKLSFWERVKNHFFDINEYKNRVDKAENSFQYFMNAIEHEGTYFIYQYSLPPYGIYGNNIPSELKFQISFKIPLWRGALWSKGSFFLAYTQTMWFQQFNYRYSSPVRDTTYKPYLYYTYPGDWGFLGGKIKEVRAGMVHYSNGIGGSECYRTSFEDPTPTPNCRSRSAGTRFIAELIWEKQLREHTFGLQFSVWPYIPSRRDNPDLPNYMGYADAKFYYRYKRHLVELQVSPVISDYTRYHGNFRVGYAFAVSKYVSLYAQYFYGYNDSLYEYNIMTSRIGIGLRSTTF